MYYPSSSGCRAARFFLHLRWVSICPLLLKKAQVLGRSRLLIDLLYLLKMEGFNFDAVETLERCSYTMYLQESL